MSRQQRHKRPRSHKRNMAAHSRKINALPGPDLMQVSALGTNQNCVLPPPPKPPSLLKGKLQ